MDDPSALIRAALAGDRESLHRLLLHQQRAARTTTAIFLPTLREVDALVLRWSTAVADTLAQAPTNQLLAWMRTRLRELIVQRLDELERNPGFSGDPLLRLLVSSGRERLTTVPVDADPAIALTGRLRLMAKGATDLLTRRFTDGADFAAIAAERHLSADDVSLAVQTACRQLDWTGDASGGALDAADYRVIDGLVVGNHGAISGLGDLRARLLDDMGLALRAVRAARLHLIAAAWHAPEIAITLPATAPAPAPVPARRTTGSGPARPAPPSRGLSTPTRRQAATRSPSDHRAPTLDDYPDHHQQRSAMVPTLIGGALVLGGIALLFLRGGSETPARDQRPPPTTTTAPAATAPPSGTSTTTRPPVASTTTNTTTTPVVATTTPVITPPVKTLFVPGTDIAPTAAWSTRRLGEAYQGPLMRVRRSNDHSERDIGPGGDGSLDRATLGTFAGKNDVMVVVWYDQSGNGHHLRQDDRARQPRIVKKGALEQDNGRPAIDFNSSEKDHFSTPAAIPVGVLSAVMRVKHDMDNSQALMGSPGNRPGKSDAYYPIVARGRTGFCEWWVGAGDDYSMVRTTIAGERLVLWLSTSDGTKRPRLTLYLDGKEAGSVVVKADALAPTGPTAVGCLYWEDQLADFFAGSLGEMIIIAPGADHTKLPALTADQRRWWKTP